MNQKFKTLKRGCGLFLSLVLLFNINTKLNAQVLKPELNQTTGIVKGLVVKYEIKVSMSDTVHSRIELSATANFTAFQTFYQKMVDSTQNFSDTITEAMGLAPAPAQYYVRVWVVSQAGDSMVSTTSLVTTLEPVTNPVLSVVQVLPHQSGCYFSMNIESGNAAEKLNVSYKFSYDSVNFWNAGPARQFIGTKTVQDSIIGLFSNKKTYLRIEYSNSIGSGDTAISFVTTLQPQKAVVEITKISAGVDTALIEGSATTFNQMNRVVAYWGTNDSLFIGNFQSLKSESWTLRLNGLKPNTTITGKIRASGPLGTTEKSFSLTTMPAPVEPKLEITKVETYPGRADVYWNFQTNTSRLFTRVDAKVYEDESETVPVRVVQIAGNSETVSHSQYSTIDLGKGTYWVRLTGETEDGSFIKSNLFKFTVNWNLSLPQLTTATEEVECKLMDMAGRDLGNVVWNGNASDAVPSMHHNKILILVPLNGKYAPFKVYVGH